MLILTLIGLRHQCGTPVLSLTTFTISPTLFFVDILKNHILDLTFCSAAVVNKAKTNTYNVLGEKLNFERKVRAKAAGNPDETLDLNEIQDIVVNKESRVTESDVMGTNGVLHVVDTVLSTESGQPITTMLGKRNLTVFKGLIEANGLDEEFDVLSNVSFFAPTDKAFENSQWKKELEVNPGNLKDSADLRKFLEYHIGLPYVKTCELNEEMVKTKAGPDLRVNLYATVSFQIYEIVYGVLMFSLCICFFARNRLLDYNNLNLFNCLI